MASQGPLSPGTVVDDATVGTVAWINPDNAKVSDDSKARASLSSTISHYLKATNFGFSIPTGATINGILVEVERLMTGTQPNVKDSKVLIIKGGVIGSTDKADTVNVWPLTDTYKSYGSSSELWGETWTPADINDSGFGFVISATGFADVSSAKADVDHIRITVYYTVEAPTLGAGMPIGLLLALTYAGTESPTAHKIFTRLMMGYGF